MNKQTLTNLLHTPMEEMSLQTLIEILRPLEKYPYCSCLYVKAAQNAKIIGRYDWKEFAAKAAVHVGDRKHLNHTLNATPYKTNLPVPPLKIRKTSAAVVAPISVASEPIATIKTDNQSKNHSKEELIERFLHLENPEIPIPPRSASDKRSEVDIENQNLPFATETMAKIFEQQGKYREAIKIYRRLELDNPKKGSTFADRIKELETLL